jgi:hypothetical protein
MYPMLKSGLHHNQGLQNLEIRIQDESEPPVFFGVYIVVSTYRKPFKVCYRIAPELCFGSYFECCSFHKENSLNCTE